jgi:hypothetical protein
MTWTLRRPPPAWAATLLLALAWLALGPRTPDLAAQVHRVGMFATHGFSVWDNTWYDGHHALGYSLVFPAVGAAVGARIVGVVAAVGSAALFESLLRGRGRRARAACWWFAVGCVADLVIGRLTYALGVTIGLGAVAAFTRGRRGLAVALAVACAATSPVAGLFLALAGVGLALARRRTEALALSGAAGVTVLALSIAFPEGGAQPFSVASFLTALAVSLGVAVAVHRDRGLRLAPLLFAAAVVASFAIASPMGANVNRLGTAFAGPLVLVAAGRRPGIRGAVVVAVLAGAAVWQWVDPAVQAARAWRDPSATAVYYRPLLRELRRLGADGSRIEVPFTRGHWESVYLARRYPLARGWERQLDRRLNPLFYAKRLDPGAYGRWLRSEGVGWVALPAVPMDVAGRQEAAIVAASPSFLQPVWRGRHWRLYRVRDPLPLATGPVSDVRVGVTDVRLAARRAGPVLLRVHWTPYWQLTAGDGCVTQAGPWTSLTVRRPGPFILAARFSLVRVVERSAICRPPESVGPLPASVHS